MHRLFPEWYRICNPNPKEKVVSARWATVAALKKTITTENALSLLRIYLGESPSKELITEIETIGCKKDISFPVRNNSLELVVLTGVTIIDILETEMSLRADILAVGCMSFVCCNIRKTNVLSDMNVCAENYLRKRSIGLRQEQEIKTIASNFNLDDELETLKTAFAEETVAEISDPTITTMESMVGLIKNMGKDVNRAIKTFNIIVEQRKEESDILWWLFPGFSTELDCSYSQLTRDQAAFVVGKELASRVRLLPGPLSASGFIQAMLKNAQVSGEASNVMDTIFSTSIEWRTKLNNKLTEVDPLFLPLTFGLIKSVEIPEKDLWKTIFETTTKIDPSSLKDLVEISHQFYLENILLKLSAQVS